MNLTRLFFFLAIAPLVALPQTTNNISEHDVQQQIQEPASKIAGAGEGQEADGAQELSGLNVRDTPSTGATKPVAASVDCENRFSQSMVYSVRSAPRRLVSLLWNELLFKSAKKWPLLRIGLHPPDWKYRGIRRHALSSIRRALADRTSMTYREWVLESNDLNLVLFSTIYSSRMKIRNFYLLLLPPASLSELALCLHSASLFRLVGDNNVSVKNS